MKHRLLPLSALALVLSAAGAAHAQQQAPGQSSGQSQGAPAQQQAPATRQPALGDGSDISDQDLQKFAKAQSEVEEIKNEYRGEIQKHAQDADKAMEVQREAQEEMVEAVQDNGLDVRKYNQIAQLAQYDSEFRERIETQR